MTLQTLVSQLVDERSLEALERLTGSRNDEVLEALIEAAGRIMDDDDGDPNDDGIVDAVRAHLVEVKAIGILTDALKFPDPSARVFALSCLSEIGNPDALPPMIALLRDKDQSVKDAAAAHLALLTKYDFGHDAKKWTQWHQRRAAGLVEQEAEDREDEARRLKLQMRRKRKAEEEAPTPPPVEEQREYRPQDRFGPGSYGR
jgi:HEAT repeat protein